MQFQLMHKAVQVILNLGGRAIKVLLAEMRVDMPRLMRQDFDEYLPVGPLSRIERLPGQCAYSSFGMLKYECGSQ